MARDIFRRTKCVVSNVQSLRVYFSFGSILFCTDSLLRKPFYAFVSNSYHYFHALIDGLGQILFVLPFCYFANHTKRIDKY